MKQLLIVTAVLETGTGLALTTVPEQVVWLLLGATLETPAALTVARVAGIALLSLGIACWLARNDCASRAAAGLVAGMSAYNSAVAVVLVYANFGLELFGVALWPAVVLHVVLLGWCIVYLWRR